MNGRHSMLGHGNIYYPLIDFRHGHLTVLTNIMPSIITAVASSVDYTHTRTHRVTRVVIILILLLLLLLLVLLPAYALGTVRGRECRGNHLTTSKPPRAQISRVSVASAHTHVTGILCFTRFRVITQP